jgi:hypothetical protein
LYTHILITLVCEQKMNIPLFVASFFCNLLLWKNMYVGYMVAEWCTSRLTYRPVTNVCAGVWVRSQLTALDKLHHIKGIFGTDHVPVVSSGHSGFLHHQN